MSQMSQTIDAEFRVVRSTTPEDYRWLAHYTDGSTLSELDEDGVERGFASVDLPRVRVLELLPQRAGLPALAVTVDSTGGQRPIFFRRRTVRLNPDTGAQAERPTVTCLGWARTVRGRSIKSFTFVFGDGSLLITDDHNAV